VKSATDSVSKSFGDLFTGIATGTRGASDILRGFFDSMVAGIGRVIGSMIEMYIWQKITGMILGGAIGGIGGSLPLSSLGGFNTAIQFPLSSLAPGRAGGGSVSAGELYQVNEMGLEFFRPDMSGTVIPLGGGSSSRGGGGMTLVQNIDARGAAQGEATALLRASRQIAEEVATKKVAEYHMGRLNGRYQ
jgi:hypothetical protein